MSFCVPAAVDDGGRVLVHRDALGAAEILQPDALQLDAGLFHDCLAAGQDRDIFQHGLAAIAKARGLHRAGTERAAQLVHYERGQGFAFHVFGNHQERLTCARNLLEDWQEVLHVADLLVVNQDVGIFEDTLHAFGIANEIG